MMEEVLPLDGNAAAGALAALFAVEPTTMMITCEGCGREGALATLKLYGGAMGQILRCPECGTANVRFTDAGARVSLDLRGSTRLAVYGGEAQS
jgi:ribosomal protein S27E